jgi:hypothetical protein
MGMVAPAATLFVMRDQPVGNQLPKVLSQRHELIRNASRAPILQNRLA